MRWRLSREEPGLVLSGAAHAAFFIGALVVFASAPPFADHEEAVAVDVITESQLRAITKGEKTAKEVKAEPKPRADKVAEKVEEKPDPGDAKTDAPSPPMRPAQIEQGETTPAPPARPEPVKQAVAKPELPKPEPPKPEAKAEPKPEPPKEAEPKPEPPKKPEPKKAEEQPKPKPPEKKPEPKLDPKLDPKELAKLIEETKPVEKPKAKPAETGPKMNLSEIQKLLQSKDTPQHAAATGQQVNRTASLGTQTGTAAKLSLSQRDALGALIKEQLASCWSPPMGVNSNVKPQVRMKLNPDGSLLAEPSVANSGSDAGFRSLAESAVRAVRRCAPFRIPPQYAPYYADWRDWNVVFDPKDFLS
jgi:hypothetical protein